jgi:PTS system nitrogen regulatory IIA component
LNSTALGDGVAIPHGKLPGVRRVIAAFARSKAGVDFQSLDGKPTHLFFLLVAPEDSAGAHLKALARISRLLKDPSFRSRLLEAPDAKALWATIRDEDARY